VSPVIDAQPDKLATNASTIISVFILIPDFSGMN
jgi:hypothetical protein